MNSIFLFILFIEICYSVEWNDKNVIDWSDRTEFKSYTNDNSYTLKLSDDFNVYRVGLEKDDREIIERPCTFEDWKCIRDFVAKNSDCTPTNGPIPDPLYLDVNTLYFSFVNLTVNLNNVKFVGLSNFTISEFYVNRDTGNVVLALSFTNLNATFQRASFRYKRTGKESIVLNDFATALYRSGIFTAVIPKVPKLRLDKAEIHSDLNDAFPPFYIGPNASNSTDPDVQTAFANFLLDIPTAAKETFLFQSNLFTAIFIQNNICDFGLKLYST